MSADKLPRHACTAALCAAFATLPVGLASAQSLSDNFSGRDVAVLRDVAQPPEQARVATAGDELAAPLRRQIVSYTGAEPAGTIMIDTAHTFLYLTLGDGTALRYGIGVGRKGFTWSGVEKISRKSEWPDWIPPAEMIARQPYLPRWVGGGPGNPLGARALYLGNTDYRIHGTNSPASIGKHVSSGCIRMRDADVIDLYDRVGIGTKVVVLPNDQRAIAADNQKEISQKEVSIEGGPGAMTARVAVRPATAMPGADAAERLPPRAELRNNPTAFGLY
ncbi:MAG: L,D-transpeptidase [Xanthobacteraceae bacterium]|nr:L,D-transpeptidase [Xanthobacteraceae bacterium]HLN47907.1 L,D-transpeptidase [Steroidobacteraceae bacterium]